MLILDIHELSWLEGLDGDRQDQCAHGRVDFRVNETVFISSGDGNWTVSATGLFLLRTLEFDHTWDDPVAEGNYLFPCCGFDVYPFEKSRFGFICNGCVTGVHVSIIHHDDAILVAMENGRSASVSRVAWTRAVKLFVDNVQRFYDDSAPKEDLQDVEARQGWAMFWREWEARRRHL